MDILAHNTPADGPWLTSLANRLKAPGVALRICREEGVRCVVFGGRVLEELPGAEMHALSGDPAGAADDLAALGEAVGIALGRA
mgnify:CR=1 FL=1